MLYAGKVHLSEMDIQYLTLGTLYKECKKFFPSQSLLLFTSLWSKKFSLVKCAMCMPVRFEEL